MQTTSTNNIAKNNNTEKQITKYEYFVTFSKVHLMYFVTSKSIFLRLYFVTSRVK